MTPLKGPPGHHAYTFVIRILSTSLTTVSVFSVCCCSRYLSVWVDTTLQDRTPCLTQQHQTRVISLQNTVSKQIEAGTPQNPQFISITFSRHKVQQRFGSRFEQEICLTADRRATNLHPSGPKLPTSHHISQRLTPRCKTPHSNYLRNTGNGFVTISPSSRFVFYILFPQIIECYCISPSHSLPPPPSFSLLLLLLNILLAPTLFLLSLSSFFIFSCFKSFPPVLTTFCA